MDANGSHGSATRKPSGQDLTGALGTAGEALRATAEEISRDSEQIKEQVTAVIDAARNAYDVVAENLAAGARVTDRAIRANPYSSLAIALTAGLALGILAKRK